MAIEKVAKAGRRYLKFARRKLAQLDALRRDLGLQVMSKAYKVGKSLIWIKSSEWKDLIYITGAAGDGRIHVELVAAIGPPPDPPIIPTGFYFALIMRGGAPYFTPSAGLGSEFFRMSFGGDTAVGPSLAGHAAVAKNKRPVGPIHQDITAFAPTNPKPPLGPDAGFRAGDISAQVPNVMLAQGLNLSFDGTRLVAGGSQLVDVFPKVAERPAYEDTGEPPYTPAFAVIDDGIALKALVLAKLNDLSPSDWTLTFNGSTTDFTVPGFYTPTITLGLDTPSLQTVWLLRTDRPAMLVIARYVERSNAWVPDAGPPPGDNFATKATWLSVFHGLFEFVGGEWVFVKEALQIDTIAGSVLERRIPPPDPSFPSAFTDSGRVVRDTYVVDAPEGAFILQAVADVPWPAGNRRLVKDGVELAVYPQMEVNDDTTHEPRIQCAVADSYIDDCKTSLDSSYWIRPSQADVYYNLGTGIGGSDGRRFLALSPSGTHLWIGRKEAPYTGYPNMRRIYRWKNGGSAELLEDFTTVPTPSFGVHGEPPARGFWWIQVLHAWSYDNLDEFKATVATKVNEALAWQYATVRMKYDDATSEFAITKTYGAEELEIERSTASTTLSTITEGELLQDEYLFVKPPEPPVI